MGPEVRNPGYSELREEVYPGVLPCPMYCPALYYPVLLPPRYTTLYHADTTASSMPASRVSWQDEDSLGSRGLSSLGKRSQRGKPGQSCLSSSRGILRGESGVTGKNG